MAIQPSRRPGRQIPEETLTVFLAAYIAHGFNGTEAGIAIGMKPRTAHANAHRYVAAIRNRLSMQQTLARAGLDRTKIAEKLAQLIDSKEPKWNAAHEDWDSFDDTTA